MAAKRRTRRPPAIEPAHWPWRVVWWDFTGVHDYVGPGSKSGKGRAISAKSKVPPRRFVDFETIEEARDFVALLKEKIGEDNVVAQVINMRQLLPPPPAQSRLPDAAEWPVQWDPRVIRPKAEEAGGGR
jgi:hypothetical protein